MKVSGSLIGEMPKSASFYKDILFYEKEFNGVMPLEIMIDTKRKKGVMKLSTMRKMDELQNTIASMPELSKPVSIVNLVKYSKQAFYNGKPEYYQLPTSQEQAFILSYAKNATKNSKDNLMKAYVDSTGQYARITTFMRDIGTDKMAKVEKKLHSKIDEIFPKDQSTRRARFFGGGATSFFFVALPCPARFASAAGGAATSASRSSASSVPA